jgi:hypothetical protein
MTLTLLSPEAYETQVAAHYGVSTCRDTEAIAEVMRAELVALGQTRRWVLEARVHALLAHFGVTKEDVAETHRALESAGDLVVGPGGEVARTPLRALVLRPGCPSLWMIAGSLPSTDVRAALGVFPRGLPRRLSTDDDQRMRVFVQEMGGRVLDVARWSGLDRVATQERFFAELEARIDSASRFADRASALSWEGIEVFHAGQTTAGKTWTNAPLDKEAMLVRARQTGGWRAYAYARKVGDKQEFVPLTGDEARRIQFVLAAKAGAPVRLSAKRQDTTVEIALPIMLPLAEYRWLAAMGEMQNATRLVRLDETIFQDARVMLEDKLGVVFEVDS